MSSKFTCKTNKLNKKETKRRQSSSAQKKHNQYLFNFFKILTFVLDIFEDIFQNLFDKKQPCGTSTEHPQKKPPKKETIE